MFENGLFASAARRNGGWLKKAFSLGISLAVHALVLVLLVVYYAPLKILEFDSEVRHVFIAPSLERLMFPVVTGAVSDPALDTDSGDTVSLPATAAPAALSEDVPARERISPPERIELPPHIPERFELRRPPEERPTLPPNLSFRIAPEKATPRFEYGPGAGSAAPRADLSKYIRPALPRFSTGAGSSSDRSGGEESSSAGNEALSRQVEIASWAETAVAMIMERWLVPYLKTGQEEDEFEITVVIQRDGWIASTEVVSPARFPQLQLAALKALELSSPLPRLPRNYPGNSLEIRLVFARK